MSSVAEIRAAVGAVPDPELPALNLDELGIVREVRLDGERVVVAITPTYSGCPALDPIREEVERAVCAQGHADVEVQTVLSPAWSTNSISEEGRRKLLDYGIAPPAELASPGCPLAGVEVRCPRCGSSETQRISQFGPTPCQAHYVCRSCDEPFNHFKTLA